MIDKDTEIIPGMIVRHDEGLVYEVDDLRRDTRDYEITHQLGGWTINYTQLQDGNFSKGTGWNKDEEGFRGHFTVVAERPHRPKSLREWARFIFQGLSDAITPP